MLADCLLSLVYELVHSLSVRSAAQGLGFGGFGRSRSQDSGRGLHKSAGAMLRLQAAALALLLVCVRSTKASAAFRADHLRLDQQEIIDPVPPTPQALADYVPELPGHGKIDFGLYSG